MKTATPVLFVGHGSPMNAIEDNEFSRGWKEITTTFPKPDAIVCISAHWETKGTWITTMSKPRTIHDFGGFPDELYEIQYPASGNSSLAKRLIHLLRPLEAFEDHQWGLDHGCWSVLRRMYPKADIPVLQVSLDYYKSPQQHYDLAKKLSVIRDENILIIGSGNMVHNLNLLDWDKLEEPGFVYDWASEANDRMKSLILKGDHKTLIDFRKQGEAFEKAINSAEHYLPVLYILSLIRDNEKIKFFNDKAVGGSLTMTSFITEINS